MIRRPPDSLRIALVCDWYAPRVGGIETHVGALAQQLAAAGHAVDALTATPHACRGAGAAAAVGVVRLDVPLLPGVEVTPALGRAARALRAALRDGAYDLVHCHVSVFAPLAMLAAREAGALGIPCVVTHHSVLGGATRAFAAADRVLGWSRWGALHTAVSPRVAAEVQAAAPALDVRVLPNAIHPDRWRTVRGRGRVDDEVRVVSAMRLARRKRPLALIEAVAAVVAALPPGRRLRVRIAGDGPQRPAVERAVRRAGLQEVVTLAGWQSPARLRALYADADAFVLPSLLESFGLAALEARCAGLPVLAMRDAGPAGFVRHEVEGLLAADDADLAAQLLRLVTDDRLRTAIARHNRATRPAETWDAVLAEHEAVYAAASAAVRAGLGAPVRAPLLRGPFSALQAGPARARVRR
ncbi:glycosyltransferase family 4 protein [Roseisolibacter agri]|uniref:Glycosyl transferase family 1 n=1 Tax=Roseisolibacter agri TaxID=2014610 RepID=A0AA37Q9Z7_9BACT|nr:glycosyltransferase family 4 protein [Roseisolibacter agri]GLC25816.1 glycosyl transferase family 1 [Roseisolibacter agri]